MRAALACFAVVFLVSCGGKEEAPAVAELDKAAVEELAAGGDEAAKAELDKRAKAEQKAAFDAAGNDPAKIDELAGNGNPWALHARGLRLLESQYPAEQRAGFVDIEAAADAGLAEAQLWVGEKYAYGIMGYPWKPNSGLILMEKAANQGLVEAMFKVGNFYFQDQPMQDEAKSRAWLKKAGDAGHAEAKAMLETMPASEER
jgi:TPR repeat protein